MSTDDLPDSSALPEPHSDRAVGQPLATDQSNAEFQTWSVGGLFSRIADAFILSDDHRESDTHGAYVAADTSAADQEGSEHQRCLVGGNSSSQPPPITLSEPKHAASDGWLELRIWAEMFKDAQLGRMGAVSRAEFGGVDPDIYAIFIEQQRRAEHVCDLELRRCYRRVVPSEIRQWVTSSKGVGDHLAALLLGHLGDPLVARPRFWAENTSKIKNEQGNVPKRILLDGEPYERTLAQLWQYCGHGDPTRRVRKGMTADELAGLGQPKLKMLVHLLAEACMKQKPGNTYRDVYEARRLVTAERLHAAPCVRCGPSGKPAAEGSSWSKGHQHADALRIVGKELLRDLWLVAREQPMAVAA